MRTPAINALLALPDPGPRSARSGSPPGDSPFAALLRGDRARTAPAEGPTADTPRRTGAADPDAGLAPRPDQPAPTDAEAPADQPAATPPAGGGQAEDAPQGDVPTDVVLIAPLEQGEATGALRLTPAAAETVPASARPAAAALASAAVAAAVSGNAGHAGAATTATTPVAATPAVSTQTTSEAQPAAATATAPAESAPDADVPAEPAPRTAPAVPEQDRGARPAAGEQAGRGSEQRQQQPQAGPPQQTAAPARAEAAARAARPASTQTAEPAPAAQQATAGDGAPQATGPQASPTGPSGPAGHAGHARGAVPLGHLPRTVEAALEMAGRRGVTHARLQLSPAELGSIEIHLRHGAGGLSARLVADSAEALQALQQSSDDLRRALEEAGIDVMDLDIGGRDDAPGSSAGAFGNRFGERDESATDRRGGSGRGAPGAAGEPAGEPTVRTRIALPGSVLLDVIA